MVSLESTKEDRKENKNRLVSFLMIMVIIPIVTRFMMFTLHQREDGFFLTHTLEHDMILNSLCICGSIQLFSRCVPELLSVYSEVTQTLGMGLQD